MKTTTTTLLDEVLPEFDVEVFSGWLRRDFEHPVLQEAHAHPNRVDGGPRMRLPNTAHTSRPWRIHELTHDFRLEDVWALPGVGGPDDFPRQRPHIREPEVVGELVD